MRVLFLGILFVSLASLVSCGGQTEDENDSSSLSGRFDTPEIPDELIIEKNRYKQFEEMINQNLANNGKKDFIYEVEPICRTFLGCIKMCSYLDSEDCTFLSAPEVLTLFEETVVQHSPEEIIGHLEWVFKDPHVSYYFQYIDQDQKILSSIIEEISNESCPLFENKDVFYEENQEGISIYISSTEVLGNQFKKVVDSTQHDFYFPLFTGLMRQCFNEKTSNVFQFALENNNQQGLILSHQLLDKSCGSKPSCIQLAYCQTNSEEVINQVQTFFSLPNLNCVYQDFTSVNSEEVSSGGVGSGGVGSGGVGSGGVGSGGVVSGEVGSGGVGSEGVGSGEVGSGGVGSGGVGSGGVSSGEVDSWEVNSGEVGSGGVVSEEISRQEVLSPNLEQVENSEGLSSAQSVPAGTSVTQSIPNGVGTISADSISADADDQEASTDSALEEDGSDDNNGEEEESSVPL